MLAIKKMIAIRPHDVSCIVKCNEAPIAKTRVDFLAIRCWRRRRVGISIFLFPKRLLKNFFVPLNATVGRIN